MNRKEVEFSCPYGNECEKEKRGKLIRCACYTLIRGTNPQTGEEVDHWVCSIAYTPILLTQIAQSIGGLQAAVESSRNENIRGLEKVGFQLAKTLEVGLALPGKVVNGED